MQVPFLSIKDITAKYSDELHEAVLPVTHSGWYLQGNENKKFEEDYARYIGTKYCVGVANGLQALELMIRACKILYDWDDGDEIIVQANTYIATILAISQNNLKPILLDPNAETLELDAEVIEKAITSKTRAVMLVHLYGRCLYNEKIDEICKNHGLKLFEDNAQAHGCMYNGKKTGSFTQQGYKHWPFDREVEFYLLIDQQIGGNWPGQAKPEQLKAKSANFDIDYVRIYSDPVYKFSSGKKKKSKKKSAKNKL